MYVSFYILVVLMLNTLSMTTDHFTVLSWNARGLNKHIDHFTKFIEECNNLPDVICVQETYKKNTGNQ